MQALIISVLKLFQSLLNQVWLRNIFLNFFFYASDATNTTFIFKRYMLLFSLEPFIKVYFRPSWKIACNIFFLYSAKLSQCFFMKQIHMLFCLWSKACKINNMHSCVFQKTPQWHLSLLSQLVGSHYPQGTNAIYSCLTCQSAGGVQEQHSGSCDVTPDLTCVMVCRSNST